MTTFNNPTLRLIRNRVQSATVRDLASNGTNFRLADADPRAADSGPPLPPGRPFRLDPDTCTGSGRLKFQGPVGAWAQEFENGREIVLTMVIPGAVGTTEEDCTVNLRSGVSAFLSQAEQMQRSAISLKRDVQALIDQLQQFLVEDLEPMDLEVDLSSLDDFEILESPTNGCTTVRLQVPGKVSSKELEHLGRVLAESKVFGRNRIVMHTDSGK